MDDSTHRYGNQGQPFQSKYPSTATSDANIDPLLDVCTTGGPAPPVMSDPMDDQFLMGGTMWNPALNNPVSFYPPSMSGMAPTLNNSSKPPTDTQSSPRTPSSEPVFSSTRTSSKSSIPSVDSVDTNSKPRRSNRSTRAQHQLPTAEPFPKPPRRRRASKTASVKEEDVEDEDDVGLDGSAKRNKFLKRNRIAASKCRQKKKEWVSNLEDTRYGLEHENNVLHKQYNGLVDELSTIKNQLMEHASCNDANINQWLDNEAKRFVQRIAAQSQASIQVQPPRGTGGRRDINRRGSSVATSIPQSIESEINYDHMPDSLLNPR